MEIPDVGDVLEIAVIGEFDDSEEVINVMQFKVAAMSAASEANLVASLRELVAALLDVWEHLATAHQVWKRFRTRNVTEMGPSSTIELAAERPGVITGDSEPPGVAALLGFYTGEAGITLRKFIGPAAQSLMEAEGEYSATALGYGADILAIMMAPIDVAYGTYNYGHISTKTAAWLVPTSGYMSAEPAYQRRRRRGKGS